MTLDLDALFSSIPDNNLDLHIDIGLSHNAPHSVEKLRDAPNTFVIGIEPHPESCRSIRQSHIPESEERFLLIPCGIADVSEVEYRSFNCVGPDQGTSSFLNLTEHYTKPVGEGGGGFYVNDVIESPVVGLKYILDRLPWEKFNSRDFTMKSDTQGYECEVLQSLGNYIHNITQLKIEISTAPNGKPAYENAPTTEDIFNLIESTSKLQFSNMAGGGDAWFTRK